MAHPLVLALNTGSSSLKANLYRSGKPLERLAMLSVKNIGADAASLAVRLDPPRPQQADRKLPIPDQAAALKAVLGALEEHFTLDDIAVVGHRIVHGGPDYSAPVQLDPAVIADLRKLIPLAPDHLPQAIGAIESLSAALPRVRQTASFDTHFHHAMGFPASHYALPPPLYDEGVRRYGFHGLSCAYLMQALQALDPVQANGKVVIAHLGSGASMTAVAGRTSVDTSMGFAPESGLVMSTRPGDIDAGAVLYLLQERGMSAESLNILLNQQSGLLGLSGSSGDMKALLARSASDARAREAVGMFCYRAQKYLGAYMAILGGLDCLIFAGGIGERSPEIRHRICAGMEWLGIELDESANARNAALVSRASSRVCVRVMVTDEDLMIARDAQRFLTK